MYTSLKYNNLLYLVRRSMRIGTA